MPATITINIVDFVPLGAVTERELTPEGFMVAPAKLARIGVQNYTATELGLDRSSGMSPTKPVRLLRPAEEVFEPASLASFESKPITDDHPKGKVVDARNWKAVAVGDVMDVHRDGDHVVGTVLVRDAATIKKIQAGKTALSNGYTFDLDLAPGKTETGEEFDGIQRRIRGNHVAIVDSARAGASCRIADSNPNGGTNMANDKSKNTPPRGRDLFRERQRTGRYGDAERVGAGLRGRELFKARQAQGFVAPADEFVTYDLGLNGGQR